MACVWTLVQRGAACAAVGAVVTLLGATASWAANVRPVTLGSSGEQTLQSVFDGLSLGGGGAAGDINVTTQQSTDYSFTSTGATTATMIIEIAGNAGSNSFGIYNTFDTSKKALIFTGSASAGATATLSFLGNGSVDVTIGMTTTNYAGIGTAFGFYISGGGGTYYSDDTKNGGDAQALIYQGAGELIELNGQDRTFLTTDWIVAFEDLDVPSISDEDYNDLVVYVGGLTPVPEPTTLMLIGGGLALGVVARRRRRGAASVL